MLPYSYRVKPKREVERRMKGKRSKEGCSTFSSYTLPRSDMQIKCTKGQCAKQSCFYASVVNLVLLKCRKLRREDQEKSDWIVSRILYWEHKLLVSQTILLQRPGPADLPYTTLGRLGPSCQSKLHNSLSKLLFSPDWTIVMLSWRVFPHVLSSLCNWSRMQQPEWSLMSRKKLTLPLSSSGYTGYQ